MPKPLRIIVVAIILVLITGFGYLLLNDSPSKPDNAQSSSQLNNASTQPVPETQQSTVKGEYTDYSAEKVADAKGRRILFFHAPWCPQCRQLDASIRSGTIPEYTTIFKVDYDSNQKLRQQYGVTIQTTLVLLDENGKELKKYVAYEQPDLQAVVENLL